MALENARIDQLPEGNPTNGDFLVYRDMVNGITKRTLVDAFLTAPTTQNYEWVSDNDPGYAIDEVVTYAGKWWQSLINDNLNILPGTDPTKWEEISKAPSGFTFWQAGVFSEDEVLVLKVIDNFIQIFRLVDATRPYVSANFEVEYANGDWELASERGYFPILKVAHGFVFGDLIVRTAGNWIKKSTALEIPLGVVKQVVSADIVIIQLFGDISKGFAGLTDGVTYYAQANGTLSSVVTAQPIMTAISTTEAVVLTGTVSIPDASETVKGAIEIATQAEVDTGTDDTRAVTPLKLAAKIQSSLEGLDWKANVRMASIGANLVLNSLQTVDAVVGIADDRILVKDQTDPKENGIYLMKSGAWVRSLDADTGIELQDATVTVSEGTVNSETTWRQATDNPTIGVSNIVWNSFGAVLPDSSETVKGKIEIATQAETDTGTDDVRAITPLKNALHAHPVVDLGNLSGAVSIDLSQGRNFKCAFTGNVTSFTFTNEKLGAVYYLDITRVTTNYTIAFTAAKFRFPLGLAPVLTNPATNGVGTAVDTLVFKCSIAGRLDVVITPDLQNN